eukprot:78007_1
MQASTSSKLKQELVDKMSKWYTHKKEKEAEMNKLNQKIDALTIDDEKDEKLKKWGGTTVKAINDMGYKLSIQANNLVSDDPLSQAIGIMSVLSAGATAMEGSVIVEVIGSVLSLISGVLTIFQAMRDKNKKTTQQITKEIITDALRDFSEEKLSEQETKAINDISEQYSGICNLFNSYKNNMTYKDKKKNIELLKDKYYQS